MKSSNRLRYLFQRYATNTATREEMDEFFDYVEDARYDSELKAVLDELWLTGAPPAAPLEESRPQRDYRWWAVAASASLILVSSLWISTWNHEQEEATVWGNSPVTLKSTHEERRLLTLPDGSSVWLNQGSKLEYPVDFGDDVREVQLMGEAFFDIRKDTLRPFVIYSGKVTTTVLGTAFNIRAFPDENAVTVTVARGKVLVRDQEKNERILQANEQISFTPASTGLELQRASADSVAEWIYQDLILDNVTFEEVATIIEERYDVNVKFGNEALMKCRFTSTFLHEASLDQMLTAICIVNRATFRFEAGDVVIDGEGCETEK